MSSKHGGGGHVPLLEQSLKPSLEQLCSLLTVIKGCMDALSGSKSISFSKSITEWHKIQHAMEAAAGDVPAT
jgi:hypothetical protein